MTRSSPGTVFRIVLALLVLAALAWGSTKFDWQLIGHQLGEASLPAVFGMAVAWLGALFIRPFRLQVLLRALAPDIERPYWNIWAADVIAMAINSVLPMRAGDMMMAFVLRRGETDRTASVFSVVLVDRLFDFATVVIIFVCALSWAPTVEGWARHLRLMLLLVLGGGAIALWIVVRVRLRLLSWIDRALQRVAPHRGERWRVRVHDLFAGIAIVDNPGVFIPVVLLSFVLWGVTATSYWLGMLAIWSPASFAAAAFTAGAVALSAIAPVSPGGIGVFHAVVVLALSLFEVPGEPALAIAIIIHAFQLGSVLVLGGLGLFGQGISVRSLAALRESRP